jgi:hypothetical protein
MISSINHLYHEDWDCICSAKPASLDFFRAVVSCRSLMVGGIQKISESTVDFDNEIQAIDLAIQTALAWTQKNRQFRQEFQTE